MATVVGIMGDSGSGKTTAFRNIDPKTTMYVDCDKKGLSWKGWKNDFNKENKNYVVTDMPAVALDILMKVSKLNEYKHIKTIVPCLNHTKLWRNMSIRIKGMDMKIRLVDIVAVDLRKHYIDP